MKEADFEIWISSSRRKQNTIEELQEMFLKNSLNCIISGLIPDYEYVSRKIEIENFIEERELNSFIIIDDDKSLNSLNSDIMQSLILTEYHAGFNNSKLVQAIEITKKMA